jgi:hypothetical protein
MTSAHCACISLIIILRTTSIRQSIQRGIIHELCFVASCIISSVDTDWAFQAALVLFIGPALSSCRAMPKERNVAARETVGCSCSKSVTYIYHALTYVVYDVEDGQFRICTSFQERTRVLLGVVRSYSLCPFQQDDHWLLSQAIIWLQHCSFQN